MIGFSSAHVICMVSMKRVKDTFCIGAIPELFLTQVTSGRPAQLLNYNMTRHDEKPSYNVFLWLYCQPQCFGFCFHVSCEYELYFPLYLACAGFLQGNWMFHPGVHGRLNICSNHH